MESLFILRLIETDKYISYLDSKHPEDLYLSQLSVEAERFSEFELDMLSTWLPKFINDKYHTDLEIVRVFK